MIIQIIINIVLSYLIGSISGSMVLGKIRGIDIRTMGSGNAGGTNAFRTVGLLFALGVVIIDILILERKPFIYLFYFWLCTFPSTVVLVFGPTSFLKATSHSLNQLAASFGTICSPFLL